MAAFLDASFWIAFRARTDERHARAVEIAKEIAGNREQLETTHYVFAEVYAYFSRMKRLREQVIADFWDSPIIRIHDTSFSDKTAAIDLLRRQTDKSYSFCDSLSFVVMQRLGLRRALAFDDHFDQFGGFEVIS